MKVSNRRIPYGKQWINREDIKSAISVLKSDFITQGPKVQDFEHRIANYCSAKHAVAVSSGTAALHIACLAAGIKQGDEVITSPTSFVASSNCILYCSGKAVFADVQEDTINIDPQEITKKITGRTKAIIVVHFAGHPCDLEEIHSIAKEYNLIVIEDAAHALGAEYKGSKVGSCKYSDMTILSFHPVKHITTGEGGAILTNRKDLYERLLMLRNHGITKDPKKFLIPRNSISSTKKIKPGSWYYEQQLLGFNYRMTDFQCALGISQLKKLDKFLKDRREIARIYSQKLSEINEIDLPSQRPYVMPSWHLYYIRLKNHRKRKIIFEKLNKSGIGVQVHYIPVHLQPYYREHFGYKQGDFPNAEKYYQQTITLPLFPAMKKKDINFVISLLEKILREKG